MLVSPEEQASSCHHIDSSSCYIAMQRNKENFAKHVDIERKQNVKLNNRRVLPYVLAFCWLIYN